MPTLRRMMTYNYINPKRASARLLVSPALTRVCRYLRLEGWLVV
jgi:hypothetical protein